MGGVEQNPPPLPNGNARSSSKGYSERWKISDNNAIGHILILILFPDPFFNYTQIFKIMKSLEVILPKNPVL
jgi:hypothetical protein